jgi:site-specific recombinase XerC
VGDLRGDAVWARGKDERKRAITLGPQLSAALHRCLCERSTAPAGGEPLLLATNGRPLDARALGELVRVVARRAGLSERLSAHALRATALRSHWRRLKRGGGASGMEGETL